MKIICKLLKLILISAIIVQPVFADNLGERFKTKLLASSLFPVFEAGYINQSIESNNRADKTGHSLALGLGLRHEVHKTILSTAFLFDYHDLSGSTSTQNEQVTNVGSVLYLGFHRRFVAKDHIFEDGLNLRTRIGQGIAYTYKGRNNIEFITSVGPEFKYISTVNDKEVRYSLGGYYDLGVVGQKVWTVVFKIEGFYEFIGWFK